MVSMHAWKKVCTHTHTLSGSEQVHVFVSVYIIFANESSIHVFCMILTEYTVKNLLFTIRHITQVECFISSQIATGSVVDPFLW